MGNDHDQDGSTGDHVDAMSDGQLDALGAELGLPAVPRPVRWESLTSDDAAEELAKLARWVRWMVCRYALDDHRTVPPCWYRHGPLVEELSALKGAWEVAFDPTQAANAPADWHMIFAHSRARCQEWAARTGCTLTEHRESETPAWARPAGDDARRWETQLNTHLRTVAAAESERPE